MNSERLFKGHDERVKRVRKGDTLSSGTRIREKACVERQFRKSKINLPLSLFIDARGWLPGERLGAVNSLLKGNRGDSFSPIWKKKAEI